MSSGSGCEMRASDSAFSTPLRSASSLNSLTEAEPLRLSSVVALIDTEWSTRYPEVVMPLFAKRMNTSSVEDRFSAHSGNLVMPKILSARFLSSCAVSMAGAPQSVTNTLIWRKRVGEQPWLMALVCSGSPLPSLVNPYCCQYGRPAMPSQLCQKSGVRLW